jgi:cobalt-zinc-cadmium efflux system membrane fusion protein
MGGQGGPVLTSPISGQVISVSVQQGQAAASGQVLVQIVDPSRKEIEAHVAESLVGRLTAVSGVVVQSPGGGAIAPRVSLEAVGVALAPQTRTLPVIFQVEEPAPSLPIGLATSGRVLLGTPQNGLAVPRSAIVDDAGLSVVYVLSNGEAFLRRVIRTGVEEAGYVEVLDGLKPGDRVVTRGAYLVRLAEAGPAAAGEGHVH